MKANPKPKIVTKEGKCLSTKSHPVRTPTTLLIINIIYQYYCLGGAEKEVAAKINLEAGAMRRVRMELRKSINWVKMKKKK